MKSHKPGEVPESAVDGLSPFPVADQQHREQGHCSTKVPDGRRPHSIANEIPESRGRTNYGVIMTRLINQIPYNTI